MAMIEITLDEAIATLRNSNLPTVVTEGADDYFFFRRMEERFKALGLSLFPVNGRSMVLDIFDRRKEIRRNDVVFLVDRDLWVFQGIPVDRQHRKIVTTDGYSIENDLIRDGNLERYLSDLEKLKFNVELNTLVGWFSFAVKKCLAGMDSCISYHPNFILNDDGSLSEEAITASGFVGPDEHLFATVIGDHGRFLRGKTLLSLFTRHLSSSGRSVKFGKKQLMEIGAVEEGSFYLAICDQISRYFDPAAIAVDSLEVRR